MNLFLAEYISRYPNGDVYLGNLIQHRNNSLDLTLPIEINIEELVKTNETYISAVFLSASTRAPAIAIALPVYQDDSNIKLMGY
jgi:hypothetical protein